MQVGTWKISIKYDEAYITLRVIEHCNKLLREFLRCLSLEVFKTGLDATLRNLT